MSQTSTAITVAQTVGIISAGFASGAIFGFSHVTIPCLCQAPTAVMLKQFASLYNIGKATAPVADIVATAAFAYLAYAVPALRNSYIGAAAIACMIGPWTLIMMIPTNDELFRRVAAAEKLKDGESVSEAGLPKGQKTPELLAKWRRLNYLRALFPLTGAIMGAWAAFA
ncbi:hypothetical protein MMC11_004674 [Xylographa trunciseda]|nr:hypothetical protein [Xylographa trunciseda]